MSKTDDSAISGVISTLGGDFIHLTIEQLYRGTVRPTEVLVCIPTKGALQAEVLRIQGVRVVVTEVRGQVAQRARAFRKRWVQDLFILAKKLNSQLIRLII
jgi:hypothetical protein